MNPSAFVIRMALTALPGILASKLYRKLRGRTEKKNWEDFVEILVFSLGGYAIYGAASGLLGAEAAAFRVLFDESKSFHAKEWGEILAASSISLFLALIASGAHQYGLVMKLGHWLRVTKRSGDEDIWYLFHDGQTREWVYVRDHKTKLLYFGWILAYSDSERERELILEDVNVYTNDTAEQLYAVKTMYVSRSSHDLSIEVPNDNSHDAGELLTQEYRNEQQEESL